MTDLAERLRVLAAAHADSAGVDLVAVQVKGTGPRTLVRVVVDRKGGVDLARCRDLSRVLGDALDDVDALDDGYQLEVTSPGVDHPLEGQRAFDRVEGRPVLVQRRLEDGRLDQLEGTVRAATSEVVVLDVDGAARHVPYSQIAKATQRLPW